MSEKLKYVESEFPKIVFKNDGSYEIQLSENDKIEKLPFKSLTINGLLVELLVEDILDIHNDENYNKDNDYKAALSVDKDMAKKNNMRPYGLKKED